MHVFIEAMEAKILWHNVLFPAFCIQEEKMYKKGWDEATNQILSLALLIFKVQTIIQ